ncbi:hypothetical protein Pmani_005062 [Petrolisthes manimaculis]|uniref:Uncharacterized protein n=1 Tax=Petrolisthes manimaculis TaxID=1843537 RepID=A0AAE1QFJ4_9EUCA|nr:hypothetical protein Pmani_005062 [Petrolisthes manimaculis]
MTRFFCYFILIGVVLSGLGEAAWPFGSQPSTTADPLPCPRPTHCALNGTWLGEAGGLKLQITRKGNQSLQVKYTLRDMIMEGEIQAPKNKNAIPSAAQVLLVTNSTPVTCLLTILTCHQDHLWVTELPLVGNASAVTYPLQPPVYGI